MPKRYKGKKRRRKRRRRYRKLPLGGFPENYVCRVRYVEEIILNAAAGFWAFNDFRCNSIYDPNATIGGGTPNGFLQLMEYYDQYCVLGSKIKAQFYPSSATNVTPGYLGIGRFNTTGTPSGEGIVRMLQSRNYHKAKGSTGLAYGASNSNAPPQAFHSFSLRKNMAGGAKYAYNDNNYKGTVSSNPVNQQYYSVMVGSIGGNDPGSVTILVTIDYIVKFFKNADYLT